MSEHSERRIVSDEARRLLNSHQDPWDLECADGQERRRILAKIEEKYREELAQAGYFRRLFIRWQKNQELARELAKLKPGPHSLGVKA